VATRPRVPSTGLTPPFGGVDRLDDDVRTFATARAPSSQLPEARLVRVVGYPVLLSREALSSAVAPPGLTGKMPRTSLCSRLVVTSTRRNVRFPSFRLSPFRPLPPSSPLGPNGSSFLRAHPASATPARPLLACPALGSQAVGAASAGCYRIAAPEGMSGVPLKRPCGRCHPNPARATRIAGAPCRTRLLPRHPEIVRKCQDLLPRAPPRARFRKPEAPSTNRSHRRVRLSSASDRMGRHWYPGLMPRTQLPTRFHAPPRDARPTCLPAIRRGRRATCRLSASATDSPPSTPSDRPTSSAVVANHLSLDDDFPFGPPPTELPQARGHLACFTALTPTASDRSPQWIYPNLIGSGTPCRETVPG